MQKKILKIFCSYFIRKFNTCPINLTQNFHFSRISLKLSISQNLQFSYFLAKIILTSLFLISKSKVNFLSAVGVKLIGGELTTRIKPISVNCPQFDSVRNKGVKFDDSFSLTQIIFLLMEKPRNETLR